MSQEFDTLTGAQQAAVRHGIEHVRETRGEFLERLFDGSMIVVTLRKNDINWVVHGLEPLRMGVSRGYTMSGCVPLDG